MFKTHRKQSYPAISPENPANSHRGKTVLVTGGGSGIGYSIALSFALAGAARIVILGRREETIINAGQRIADYPGVASDVLPHTCDVASISDVDSLFADLDNGDVKVDILILNAAYIAKPGPTFCKDGGGISEIITSFDVNVKGNMYMIQKFLSQSAAASHQRVILNISSAAAHKPLPNRNIYGSSKAAAATIFQGLADELKGQVQMISVHPGAVLSETAMAFGLTREGGIPIPGGRIPWDDDDLPGHFCTWAASAAAAFLHGRFVWANWDVAELEAMKGRLEAEPDLLRLGLVGWTSNDAGRVLREGERKEGA